MLLIAGDHVPVMLFVEVVDNSSNLASEQIEGTGENSGIERLLTVIIVEFEQP